MTRLRARLAEDRGSAMVEFLGAALILLVPLLYLVLVLAQVQSAAFAAEGAARESMRASSGTDVCSVRGGKWVSCCIGPSPFELSWGLALTGSRPVGALLCAGVRRFRGGGSGRAACGAPGG